MTEKGSSASFRHLTDIDELFSCGKFCAVLRNSNFNSGTALILVPCSLGLQRRDGCLTEHNALRGAARSAPIARLIQWRRAGLHEFVLPALCCASPICGARSDVLQHCPLFDPTSPNASAECTRLPGIYNGDIGLYYTNANHWVRHNR